MLAVEDAALGDSEAEGLVCALGGEIVELRVGGDFGAALGAGPVFGGAEEGSADALAAVGFGDEPALDVADGMRGVAAVGAGAKTGFEEADQSAVGGLRDKNDEGKDAEGLAGKDLGELFGMVSRGGIGPEGVAHACQLAEVRGLGETDGRCLHECQGKRKTPPFHTGKGGA